MRALLTSGFIIFGLVTMLSQSKKDYKYNGYLASNNKTWEVAEGSPYLFDELLDGTFTITTDSVAKNIKFKYNIKDDVVEAEVEGIKVNLYKHLYSEFSFSLPAPIEGKKDYVFRNGLVKGDLDYYEIVYESDHIMFLNKHLAEIKEITFHRVGVLEKEREFIKKEFYFILYRKKFHYVKKNKKSILSVLGKNKQLDKFIKANNINFKKEEDIIKVMEEFSRIKSKK